MSNNAYNSIVDSKHLSMIARGNHAGARVLYNLGFFISSLCLFQESIEKYLKVLWAHDKTFQSKEDFDKQLKKFGHNCKKILNSLDENIKNTLLGIAKKYRLNLYDLIGLRYGLPLVVYNESYFRGVENIIKEIRKLINEPREENLCEEISATLVSFGEKEKEDKRKEIIKQVLSLHNF